MSKLTKFLSFIFISFIFIQPAYAAKAGKAVSVEPFLNKHGAYSNAKAISGGNDLQALIALGMNLCLVISVLIGLVVLIKGCIQFIKSQRTGETSNPRALIVGLIFSAAFVSITPSIGLFSSLNCSNADAYKCAIWNDETSGITGSLKEKIDNVMEDNYKTIVEKHKAKYIVVIGLFQLLAFIIFMRQLVLLYSWANGSSKNETPGSILLVAFCAALVVDLPHTLVTISSGADLVIETFKDTK